MVRELCWRGNFILLFNNLKKQQDFLYQHLWWRDSNLNSRCSFSLAVPFMMPVIANDDCIQLNSFFDERYCCKFDHTLHHHSLMGVKNSNLGCSGKRCSVISGVLKNFAKFTGKHLCQRLFFNKVARLQLCEKRESGACNFIEK